jgi:hypothetical protein
MNKTSLIIRIEYESNILEYGQDENDNNFIIYSNGLKYIGEIKKNDLGDDFMNGKGKLIKSNGKIIEGEFKNDKLIGNVTIMDKNGEIIFKGEVDDEGKYTGNIIEKYDDLGIYYKGQILKNEKEGIGKLTFKNGDYYIGEFKNGKRNGRGIYISESKYIKNNYEGEWKNDLAHGKGKSIYQEVYENGEIFEEIYEGEFIDDLRSGKGELKIKGYWKNDLICSQLEKYRRKIHLEKLSCNYLNNSNPAYERMFPDDEVYTFY